MYMTRKQCWLLNVIQVLEIPTSTGLHVTVGTCTLYPVEKRFCSSHRRSPEFYDL